MTCCNTASATRASDTAATPQGNATASTQCNCPAFRPAADIVETPSAFTVTLDMPGCSADSIDVQVHGSQLTVTGKVRPRTQAVPATPGPAPTAGAHREYGVGDFSRAFRVGTGIDLANINARYELGVLTLTLPKAEQARSRRINITANS